MKEQKYHIYLTNQERSEIIESLIDFKNLRMQQGKYTDAVDEVLVKVIRAKNEETQSCLHLNIAWAAYSPLGGKQPFSYYIALNPVPLFRFRKGGFFVFRGSRKIFLQLFFRKTPCQKPPLNSE